MHEHLRSKYVEVYETGNGREVTNAEPEAEGVWLVMVTEANVELLEVEAREAVVLEADKVVTRVESGEEDADAG